MISNLQPIKMLIKTLPNKSRLQLVNDLLQKEPAQPKEAPDINDRYLRPKEAAFYVGLSKKTLERYRKSGLLTTHKLNQRVVRYKVSELDVLLTGTKDQES